MTRIQIELSEEQLHHYEKLMKKCGMRTKKDLINNALTLLEWAINARENGSVIAAIDEEDGRYAEVLLPIFSNIKKVVSGTSTKLVKT